MTRDAKGTATIRRRRARNKSDFEKFKNSRPSSPTPLEEINEFIEEDEGYLFDDEVLGPSVIKKIMSSEKTLLLSLISLRLVNSLLIQTSFVPDEYWQSVEVSHNMVFGYGYLTWEWKHGLRGYLYPSVFAVFYKLLALFGLDNRLLLIKLPRLIQGVIAAIGDLYLYKFSWLLCDRATAQWTLLCQTVNWFMLYCSTRTLTNSTETALITAALFYFPWPGKQNYSSQSVRKFLSLAALSIIVRPTAAVIWVLLCSWHLQNNKHQLFKTVKSYILVGVCSLGLSATIDRIFYGEWTCVQYNFLVFNVFSGGGAFYGTHPWHWYFTQGYPVIMATHIFPFVVGAWRSKNKVPLFVIIWTVIIYSLLSHKEFRFLMPILPLSFHYCGIYFNSLCRKPKLKKRQIKQARASLKNENTRGSQESLLSIGDESGSTGTEISSEQSLASTETSGISSEADTVKDKDSENSANDNNDNADPKVTEDVKKRDLSTNEIVAEMEKRQRETHKNNLSKAKIFVLILLVTNIPAAMYFSLIHQRGTILVMKYIHDASLERNVDVMFLMPCHSTPYYSYIHRNISMNFITCEPNLERKENYTDSGEIFFNDPVGWLKKEYGMTSRPWPSHLVYFSPLQKQLGLYLTQSGYKDCASFFHTHFPEGRVGTHVIVSCR
ncbi:GPI mannosyltransferase 3-like [Ruditapes philippinarum]|uniref:GPI mannosyltransferase 3-like n=1 Tax=Ruditapes philippinarum TaxID=129788 RepID=UPI00295B4E95|nr:GPI mannosyltransferase 3-like [Ruditapes philippinarum]XP_060570498.1 GPI mannosyltransferase 3-like [Ruditapes philippinarum]XP_060570499.1 GPI mannosyltransferase 3-like [Ruditapes philippinarum]